MSPILKPLRIITYVAVQTFLWLIVAPLVFVLQIICLIFSLPYMFFYYSANIRMRRRDCPPVELYLRYFEQLHPDLIAYTIAAHERLRSRSLSIEFWPHEKRTRWACVGVMSLSQTNWTYSQSAGLFAQLESAGWDRRLLWTFLRDQVERTGWVNREEAKAFAEVMDRMTSHDWYGKATSVRRAVYSWFGWSSKIKPELWQKREKDAEMKFSNLGMPIYHVKGDSLDWILHRGALLVPDYNHRTRMRHLATFKPVWMSVGRTSDMENGREDSWQYVDDGYMYPWHGK